MTPSRKLQLKETRGWFPAGDCVRRARSILSDGAFKLYVSIALDADARTGRFEATQKELAKLLGKSKRIIGVYIGEIETKAICRVLRASNQHWRTAFEVCDDYWPYHRDGFQEHSCESEYVARVRKAFLGLDCTSGLFGRAEERFAAELQERGIPIETVEDAIAMAAIRKYISWLNHGRSAPIASLRYIEPVMAEIKKDPWPPGYRENVRRSVDRYAKLWQKAVRNRETVVPRGISGYGPGGDR